MEQPLWAQGLSLQWQQMSALQDLVTKRYLEVPTENKSGTSLTKQHENN